VIMVPAHVCEDTIMVLPVKFSTTDINMAVVEKTPSVPRPAADLGQFSDRPGPTLFADVRRTKRRRPPLWFKNHAASGSRYLAHAPLVRACPPAGLQHLPFFHHKKCPRQPSLSDRKMRCPANVRNRRSCYAASEGNVGKFTCPAFPRARVTPRIKWLRNIKSAGVRKSPGSTPMPAGAEPLANGVPARSPRPVKWPWPHCEL